MATFQQWLARFETGQDNDPVAWLAQQWKAREGNRPRVSSPTGIEKALLAHPEQSGADLGISADAYTSAVHQAVAAATESYRQDKAREQLGEPATSSGETATAGETNPKTGKPVAVVGSRQWADHPQADKFGTCETCGWALGVTEAGKFAPGRVLTCAAGHIVNQAAQPGPHGLTTTEIGAAVGVSDTDPEGTADQAAYTAGSELEAMDPGMFAARLSRIELMLAAICTSLGLPTDPDSIMVMIGQAMGQAAVDGELLLSTQLGPAAITDFAQLYAVADPSAQE